MLCGHCFYAMRKIAAEQARVGHRRAGDSGIHDERRAYFWPLPSVNRFSLPTTLPCNVPGMNVSLSTSPCLASAMVTRFTSRVRPTARSYEALASRRSAEHTTELQSL